MVNRNDSSQEMFPPLLLRHYVNSQVLHLKWYYFPISNITLFTDYSVWAFSSYLYSFLVSNEKWGTKKPDISNPSKRNYLWHEKKIPEVHFIFNIHSSVFWSRYCSSAFILLLWILNTLTCLLNFFSRRALKRPFGK